MERIGLEKHLVASSVFPFPAMMSIFHSQSSFSVHNVTSHDTLDTLSSLPIERLEFNWREILRLNSTATLLGLVLFGRVLLGEYFSRERQFANLDERRNWGILGDRAVVEASLEARVTH